MECPKCHFENPERMKYCGKCGAGLGKRSPPAAIPRIRRSFSFCGECGHTLSTPLQSGPEKIQDENLARIQKYLPEGLTQKILAQKDRIEGERKQVTVMFCDMEGFTPSRRNSVMRSSLPSWTRSMRS